jgi:hypothetical protein
MGTRKNSGHTEEASTESVDTSQTYVLARVFRGCLDIIGDHNNSLSHKLIDHIRGFDRDTHEEENKPWFPVLGFWRMMLELVMRVYMQVCVNLGIILVMSMVILAWPVRFLVELCSGSWMRRSSYDPYPQVEPSNDNIEGSDKVVRRVVYEEAKVGAK